jgi:hypothetical protein
MTAHCVISESEPFTFICPSCEAEYKVVTTGTPSDSHHRRIGCLRCDALLPAAYGNVFLKYILMEPQRGKARNKPSSVGQAVALETWAK